MYNLVTMEPVGYLVIGHVSQDLTSSGSRLGGTAAYSALTAKALGLRVGVLTSSGPETDLDVLQDILVVSAPSEHSTTFENIYSESGRRQVLHHHADRLSFENIPEPWRRTAIIHLGPVAQEIDTALPDSSPPHFWE